MNIKSIILAVALVAVAVPCAAQRDSRARHDERKPKEITEMVGDLSQSQKKRLDDITDASKQRVAALRAQKKAVRDSINTYMRLDGDQSAVLFPLFDREAQLQREISREMYTTKVRVDEVLTPEQRKQLRQASDAKRSDPPKKKLKK